MWVIEHFHYLDFSVDLLQIHSIQLRFVNDFYCHLQINSKSEIKTPTFFSLVYSHYEGNNATPHNWGLSSSSEIHIPHLKIQEHNNKHVSSPTKWLQEHCLHQHVRDSFKRKGRYRTGDGGQRSSETRCRMFSDQ